MPDKNIIAAAREVERRTGVSASALLAVAEVESASRAFALVNGRAEPLIRFEGHWFDRLLHPARRAAARAAGLSSPRAGAIRNPAAQSARWRLLEKAAAIDPEVAYAATSWGLAQVMGLHWKRLGFASARALAEEARRSPSGQLLIAARFLKAGGLDRMLAEKRFVDFARSYNGPGFRANRYEAKIERAFEAAETLLKTAQRPGSGPLRAARFGGDGDMADARGWALWAKRLCSAVKWLFLRNSTSTGTLSSSISTEPSSSSRTTPPPFG